MLLVLVSDYVLISLLYLLHLFLNITRSTSRCHSSCLEDCVFLLQLLNLLQGLHVFDLRLRKLIVRIIQFALKLEVEYAIVYLLIDDRRVLHLHRPLSELQ